jgi:hypothetical protein
MAQMKVDAEEREIKLLRKFCLLLNEKKLKIKELKENQNREASD